MRPIPPLDPSSGIDNVSGKISEEQLDHQRRFIGERLERLRARLDEYRARESAQAGRRVALEQVVEWAHSVGSGLDGLGGEERRELLDLLLEEATIDGENRVTLTLAIPADEDLVRLACPSALCPPLPTPPTQKFRASSPPLPPPTLGAPTRTCSSSRSATCTRVAWPARTAEVRLVRSGSEPARVTIRL